MLKSLLISSLSKIPEVTVYMPKNCIDSVVSISVQGIKSETLLHFLASFGVYISSGSACALGKPSHVLNALDFSDALMQSSIRISFSRYNSEQHILRFTEILKLAIEKIEKIR